MSKPVSDNRVVMILDDEALPMDRQVRTYSGLIRQAADQGAKGVVLDMYFLGCPNKAVDPIKDAIRYANDKGTRILAVMGREGRPCFTDGVILGHNIAIAANDSPQKPLHAAAFWWMRTYEERDYLALPIVAGLSMVGGCTPRQISEIARQTQKLKSDSVFSFQDVITEESHPPHRFLNYRHVNMRGAVIFVGPSVDAEGRPTDVIRRSDGKTSYGVYAQASAYWTFVTARRGDTSVPKGMCAAASATVK